MFASVISGAILWRVKLGIALLQLNIKGGIDMALKNEFSDLYVKFQQRYCDHLCDKTGCGDVLVIDGHMKAHRKICKATGCPVLFRASSS